MADPSSAAPTALGRARTPSEELEQAASKHQTRSSSHIPLLTWNRFVKLSPPLRTWRTLTVYSRNILALNEPQAQDGRRAATSLYATSHHARDSSAGKIGRASCRERVEISEIALAVNKKHVNM